VDIGESGGATCGHQKRSLAWLEKGEEAARRGRRSGDPLCTGPPLSTRVKTRLERPENTPTRATGEPRGAENREKTVVGYRGLRDLPSSRLERALEEGHREGSERGALLARVALGSGST